MFNKLRNIISHPEHKILLKNTFSLSILQFANYILPLITIPYVVRVIGPDRFGLVSFAQAFVTYFLLVVNYGFDLSATREISSNRDDKNALIQIYSDAILIARKGSTQKIKHIVEELKDKNRVGALEHKTVYRPWGEYTVLEEGERYEIKRIVS